MLTALNTWTTVLTRITYIIFKTTMVFDQVIYNIHSTALQKTWVWFIRSSSLPSILLSWFILFFQSVNWFVNHNQINFHYKKMAIYGEKKPINCVCFVLIYIFVYILWTFSTPNIIQKIYRCFQFTCPRPFVLKSDCSVCLINKTHVLILKGCWKSLKKSLNK